MKTLRPLLPLILLTACSNPGRTPNGQPPLTTFTTNFNTLIGRFNQASPDQIQVVAMFSPT
jgi:uncharacterized lipoprotein YajG